jgi:two-component system chemotaxis response regulator CheB
MPNRDLVVIGASAGGIGALQQLCAALPSELNAAVLVVVHTEASSSNLLPRVLHRAGCLNAVNPSDGEEIRNGTIYVAPPDRHMVVEGHHLRLVRGPRENHHRPAIDPTFRSAALAYGPRVVGVVLTGCLDDGTGGLMVVRAHGGEAVVQNPSSAMFPSMPESALKMVPDAHIATLEQMPALIAKLVSESLESFRPAPAADALTIREVRMAELGMSEVESDIRVGKPSVFGCPECGGVLWEIHQGGLLRFRCRVGHAYTAQHLKAEQRQVIESALWAALRALEERASLFRRLAARARSTNLGSLIEGYEERAATAEVNSRTLRDFLVHVNAAEFEVDEAAEPLDQARAS